MSDQFSELDTPAKADRVRAVNERWGQLYNLEKEWGERTLRYLLVTNAGGAIATLSFLGASSVAFELKPLRIALVLFILGVVLVGISNAKQYHHMSSLFSAWKRETDRYFNSEMTWADLNRSDTERAVTDFWDYVFPYCAFACFLAGCGFGALALFSV